MVQLGVLVLFGRNKMKTSKKILLKAVKELSNLQLFRVGESFSYVSPVMPDGFLLKKKKKIINEFCMVRYCHLCGEFSLPNVLSDGPFYVLYAT